jgi:hypothetical protein
MVTLSGQVQQDKPLLYFDLHSDVGGFHMCQPFLEDRGDMVSAAQADHAVYTDDTADGTRNIVRLENLKS